MRCPFCASTDGRVVDSRLSKEATVIRRRRECAACGRRFTTYERVEELSPLVVKKDGRREHFDRRKVIAGLERACEKRPISAEQIDRIADDVERQIQGSGEKEVPSAVVGDAVMQRLRSLDQVAYVRFASVYRDFRDVDEFMEELRRLIALREEGE
ncbi:MAG: transcriptional repressor NrdR [Deltaproteobacteria bacterium]|nr:MAG: transcriptional repressor NrdR [Deltaproteobacteria bacterium]